MSLDIIVGAQWGDEGKGRIVDLMAYTSDYICRYNGGDNAGHSVMVLNQLFKLHLIPSGIVHSHSRVALGNGMVINPSILIKEMNSLKSAGIKLSPERLMISFGAHIINPAHLVLDRVRENARGKSLIGTTLRGTSLAYADKITYGGIRAEAMLDPGVFSEAVYRQVESLNKYISSFAETELPNPSHVADEYCEMASVLAPYVGDVSASITDALRNGKRVIAEGAQGTLLDIDHGTYPFVTCSSTVAPGALVGLGLGVLTPIDRVIGVTKAFQTRVGSGPFPTELFDETATFLRGTGTNPWDEFGTTTGRPRRVGWLDIVLLRYAARVNGLSELAATKLDVLSGLRRVKLCVGYQRNADCYDHLPLSPTAIDGLEPVYEEMDGWDADVRTVRDYQRLPIAAQHYIERIEQLVQLKVRMISVGPERDQMIIR